MVNQLGLWNIWEGKMESVKRVYWEVALMSAITFSTSNFWECLCKNQTPSFNIDRG